MSMSYKHVICTSRQNANKGTCRISTNILVAAEMVQKPLLRQISNGFCKYTTVHNLPDLPQTPLGQYSLHANMFGWKTLVQRQQTHLGVDVRYLFDSAAFSRPAMSRSDDTSISPLTKFLDILVLRVHNEVGVQSG